MRTDIEGETRQATHEPDMDLLDKLSVAERLNTVLSEFGLAALTFTPAPSGVNRSWIAEGVRSLGTGLPHEPVLVTGRSRHTNITPEYLASVTAAAAAFGTAGYRTTDGHEYVSPDRHRRWTGERFTASASEWNMAVTFEDRDFMVRRYIPGSVDRNINEGQARAVGELLSDLGTHYWADITIFGVSSILNEPVISPDMPTRLRTLIETAEPARAVWHDAQSAGTNGPPVVIHGDLFTDNIVWTDDRTPIPIDWETAGFAPPALDLAVAILGCCRRDGVISKRLSNALLDGYHTPVSNTDLETALIVAKAHLSVGRWLRQNDLWRELA